MIINQKCDSCAFAPKCVAKAKLKAFSEESKVDLGVTLKFESCADYKVSKKIEKEED